MKKKILAVLMAATMVSSLVACGSESAPATTDTTATEAPAADAVIAKKLPNLPMMTRKELPSSADISNRYISRIFYHWKDNKEKGIIKVFIHMDDLAQEREPDVLNYDVLYWDADSNAIFWRDHVAKCVACFGKPVVDGPTPDSPKSLVINWAPRTIDSTVTSLAMEDLPADDYIVTSDNELRSFPTWKAPSDQEKGESKIMRIYRMGKTQWKSPSGEESDAALLNVIFKKNGKFYYTPNVYALIKQGSYRSYAFDENPREIELTDFKEERVLSAIEQVQASIAKGPSPVKKADIPKQAWKGPKIEKELKALVKGKKIVKLIITSENWEYQRSWWGAMLYRWVSFDIVFEGKNKQGKKAFFYKKGYIAKQMHNGSDFDKHFVMTGTPVSWNREITDWK